MNKNSIVEILKEEEKQICKDCKADVDKCFTEYRIHKFVNRILDALNGGG